MKQLLFIALLSLNFVATAGDVNDNKTSVPTIGEKVEQLLKKMTLEEKVGQLNQYDWNAVKSKTRDSSLQREIKDGKVGSFLNIHGAAAIRDLQKIAVEESRLGIPLVFALDVIHGYKTVFPVPLAEAASWDLQAIEKSARIAAIEASSAGVNWTFAPMVDIARDPRWGRIMEGAGEDPYLGSKIAAARVRGFQGNDLAAADTILACAKHYAAYGAAEAGREYNTADMSLIRLWEVYLPPFKAAVDAGVGSVMLGFNELNGIPTSANKYLVTDVLKNKWRFSGFTVSDYGSFSELTNHGYAADRAGAAELAINTGGDMDMQSYLYIAHLANLVRNGRVKEDQINDSVRRILTMKFKLGLFDDPYRYCSEQREKEFLLAPDHIKAAREIARKCIVLLKNDGRLLPIKKDIKTIAVIGMLADSKVDILGGWADSGDREVPVTLMQALKERLGDNTTILYEPGYKQYGYTTDEMIDRAVRAAKKADLTILTIGENSNMSGECASRADIGLPHDQPKLADAIAKLKKPTVVVLMNGRPLTIKAVHDGFPAILETWFLGTQAGPAITDVLFGDYNPSGKLPVTFPLVLGQVPIYYAQKNTGRPAPPVNPPWGTSKYSDVPNDPLYPFGFGLSYTTFEYADVKLSAEKIKADQPLNVSVTVKNAGQVEGEEVVQLYIRDLVASVTKPVKELRGFQKISLKPGEAKNVVFTLTNGDLAFYDNDMNFKAEPGKFNVFVGTNSRDVKEASFYLE